MRLAVPQGLGGGFSDEDSDVEPEDLTEDTPEEVFEQLVKDRDRIYSSKAPRIQVALDFGAIQPAD